jgi:citrate synthase
MNEQSMKKSRRTLLRTEISQIQPGRILIKGYDLIEMIGEKSFGDLIFLLFKGDLPKNNEGRMIEAILVSSCEHGLATPSTNAARSVASGGVPLQTAVAAGMIGLGDFHGGAIEQCARLPGQRVLGNGNKDHHGISRPEETNYGLWSWHPCPARSEESKTL